MDLIVNFAPTGMIPTKAMTPHVPVSVQEIIEDVHEAYEIGITMVHLHARDAATGEPTYKAEVHEQIIAGIRKFAADLVIGVSLSGRNFQEVAKRAEPLQLEGNVKPDMGSLTLSSLNFNKEASMNAPGIIQALATEMKSRHIMPELEAFDIGMLNYAKYLERKELIAAPHYVNLIVGNVACAQTDLLHVGLMIQDLPLNSVWSMGGVGDVHALATSLAIVIGGGVRVGIEDTIWYDTERTKLARNADLVHRVKRLAEVHNRKVMPPNQLRELLHLQPGSGRYGRKS